MIRFLRVAQLALIDELELEFEPGLTVLTGETGAGKSILVGALGLLVGERASTDLVRTGEESATVEAVFEKPDGTEIVVRRNISAQGRSRAFIDDALVTSSALKALGGELLDLHGQHEHQALLAPKAHLDLLDQYAGLQADRESVEFAFAAWRDAHTALAARRTLAQKAGERADVLRFQLGEIESAQPKPGEDDELTALKQRLANADAIRQLSAQAHQALYEGDGAVLGVLSGIWRDLEALAALDPGVTPLLQAKESVTSQLEDLAFAVRRFASSAESSPDRLQEVEDRLAQLQGLARKYGQGSIDRVLERQRELTVELDEVAQGASRLENLERQLADTETTYLKDARRLSRRRRRAAENLTGRLEALLHELAMERTRCEFRFTDPRSQDEWSGRGIDEGELYLAPNQGEELRPLARIASGGELSRIMLALKTAASTDAVGKTLVFDEVDAGIGGRVADVVGRRLKGLGGRCQVLCVTHLPQIAVHGERQVEITKSVGGGRTVTRATRLDPEARVEAIARMMTGGEVSELGRLGAKELLEHATSNLGEYTAKGRHRG